MHRLKSNRTTNWRFQLKEKKISTNFLIKIWVGLIFVGLFSWIICNKIQLVGIGKKKKNFSARQWKNATYKTWLWTKLMWPLRIEFRNVARGQRKTCRVPFSRARGRRVSGDAGDQALRESRGSRRQIWGEGVERRQWASSDDESFSGSARSAAVSDASRHSVAERIWWLIGVGIWLDIMKNESSFW
jgi:hypothetical protein